MRKTISPFKNLPLRSVTNLSIRILDLQPYYFRQSSFLRPFPAGCRNLERREVVRLIARYPSRDFSPVHLFYGRSTFGSSGLWLGPRFLPCSPQSPTCLRSHRCGRFHGTPARSQGALRGTRGTSTLCIPFASIGVIRGPTLRIRIEPLSEFGMIWITSQGSRLGGNLAGFIASLQDESCRGLC